MNHSGMNSIPVEVPPIEEQRRIVDRVGESMILCEKLKEQLSATGVLTVG